MTRNAQEWGQNGENSKFFKNRSSCIPFERKLYANERLFKTFGVKINISPKNYLILRCFGPKLIFHSLSNYSNYLTS